MTNLADDFSVSDRVDHGAYPQALALSPLFLLFSPIAQTRFDQETDAARCRHLRQSFIIGLLFLNAHAFSDYLLMHDIWFYASAMRLLLVTPVVLGLCMALDHLSSWRREASITVAMIAVVILQAGLIAISTSPRVGYAFVEIPLTLVFGGMMLVLTFLNIVIFTLATAAIVCVAIAIQPAFAGDIAYALLFQTATACVFVCYGNRRIEFVHRTGFLTALREKQKSAQLESVRNDLTMLSTTDPLTGLANRRALDAALLQCEAAGRTIGLIMIDIDYFKQFNDTYGHVAGDACLKTIAATLSGTARPRDLVARFGGEEFVVVVDDCDEGTLAAMIERLQARVRQLRILHAARPDGKTCVTVSVGGATLDMTSGASSALIELADAALYAAKLGGRDLSTIAPRFLTLAA